MLLWCMLCMAYIVVESWRSEALCLRNGLTDHTRSTGFVLGDRHYLCSWCHCSWLFSAPFMLWIFSVSLDRSNSIFGAQRQVTQEHQDCWSCGSRHRATMKFINESNLRRVPPKKFWPHFFIAFWIHKDQHNSYLWFYLYFAFWVFLVYHQINERWFI